jgi:hypothetical protein
LRYRFESGASATMTMDMDMTMAVDSDALSIPPYAMPTMRTVMGTTTGSVAADGSARFDFQYLSTGPLEPFDDPVTRLLDGWMDQMTGISGWFVMDELGQTLEGGIDGLAELDPMLQEAMADYERTFQETSAPLPVEPVGIGARWRTEQRYESGGLTISATFDYSLLDRTDDMVVLAVESTQSADPGPADLPGYPEGSDIWLVEQTGSGSGTMRLALDGLTMTTEMDLASRQVIEVDGAVTTTDTSIRIIVRSGSLPIGPSV